MPESRLRVAIFSDSFPPILNGVSVSIESLVEELRRRGHSVHIFTSGAPGYRDADPNVFRFRSVVTPWAKGYPLAVPPFYPMLFEFRKHEYDIVHTHTPYTVGFVGLRWAQSHGIPIVSTYHTLYDRYAHYVPFLPRRYARYKIAKHTNYYYNRVNQVITPTEASLRWLQRHSVYAPITVIPTGIVRRRMVDRGEARLQLGIDPLHRIMLYVGRLADEKNLDTLFSAACLVFDADPQARLWLVGDGPYRDACANIVRSMEIGDRVRLVGAVPRSDVETYYSAADAFVFSSVTETQGLVVQEAMLHGLPSVVVQGGGASAALKDGVTGFIVKNDPTAIADRVMDLFEDERLYAEISEAAAREAREFTVQAMTDRTIEVYHRAMAAGSPYAFVPENVKG